MYSVVNVYHDHLKLCVLMVEDMSVVVNVMLSLMSVMKNVWSTMASNRTNSRR